MHSYRQAEIVVTPPMIALAVCGLGELSLGRSEGARFFLSACLHTTKSAMTATSMTPLRLEAMPRHSLVLLSDGIGVLF